MNRRGFTLVEVLTIVFVLVLGLFSAVAVLRYGMVLARDAQASALALPTAMTVMRDTQPLGIATADYDRAGSNAWEGYVNGLYVRRKVHDKQIVGGQTFATIEVEVFWGADAQRALTVSERVSFHAP